MNRKVQAGGASTIDGVRYQMLWSLFRTTELRILSCTPDKATSGIVPVLRLEPVGGGGDLQEISPSKIVIEQTKSRFNGGTWSLRDVIDGVLPDLYRAIDTKCSSIVYRFVTEGKIGEWQKVYEFFQNLRTIPCPASDVLSSLDNTVVLPFRKNDKTSSNSQTKDVYWRHSDYTQKSLFEHIANVLRTYAPAKDEPLDSTHRNLWHLLSNFEVDELRSMESLQSAIDDSLLAMGCPNNEIDTVRRAMIGELEERSTSDNKVIDVDQFIKEYGLSIPISNWLHLRNNAQAVLQRQLKINRYDAARDVRPEQAVRVKNACVSPEPIVVVSGHIGAGKKWAVYGAANLLAEQRLVVVTDASGNAERDIQKASEIFCRQVWGLDQPLAISSISEKLRHSCQTASPQWLTLCLTELYDLKEAQQLAAMEWEKWGVNLLISCTDLVAETMQESRPSGIHQIPIQEFDLKELHTYLSKNESADWPNIPEDIKKTLKRPQFAEIYHGIVKDSAWTATLEYKFYSQCWQIIRKQSGSIYLLDEVLLRRLAYYTLKGKNYPWLGEQLLDAGFDNDAITRLMKAGWLQTTLDHCFEVTLPRFLNWAAVEGLVAAFRAQEITAEELCDNIQNLYHSGAAYSNQNFGYVPMDVLWLLVNRAPHTNELVDRIILAFEDNNWHAQHTLYRNMLPTIGEQIVPALIRRLKNLSPSDTAIAFELYEALAEFDRDKVAPEALKLLDDELPHIRRFGCRVLAKCPSSIALDMLWKVHCDIYNNPNVYVQEPEDEPGRMVYRANEESRDALLACVPLQPDWLINAVRNADPLSTPMHDLAHLATALEGYPDVWKQCKEILLNTVSPQHDYLIAYNIYLHCDSEEVKWLSARLRRVNDWGAQNALTALTRVAPDLALQELSDPSIFEVGLNKIWCFSHLLLVHPDETRSCILRHLQTTANPWKSALAYSGSEDLMDVQTLELLLNALEIILDQLPNEDNSANSSPLWNPLGLLCNIHRLDLLHCFMQRRGSSLEAKLTDWLLAKARQQHFTLQHENENALTVLSRFGGEGYTHVVNAMLISKNVYAKYDGLIRAHRQPDSDTLRLLRQISLQDGENSRREFERGKALIALARCEQWSDFICGVVHCGFKCPAEIGDGRLTTTPLDDAAMKPAFDSLVSSSPSVGAILAVGLGQRKDKADILCDLIERVPAESEIAQACVQSLGLLGDCGGRSINLLKEQLSVPAHYRPAWIALVETGSHEAEDILVERLTKDYDHIVAINLLKRPRVAQEVANLVQNHLASQNVKQFSSHREFEELTAYLDDEALLSYILLDDDLQERLRSSATASEGMIWYSGSRATAIQALSTSDKDEAYEIAYAALRNPDAHDRELYPVIMGDLKGERASIDLFKQMVVEKATGVRRVIGRVLSNFVLHTMLTEKLHSQTVEERIAACYIATWQANREHLHQRLFDCLEDSSRTVVHAATDALCYHQTVPIIDDLISAYHQTNGIPTKWMLLDTILDLGDPGSAAEPLPEWIHRLCDGVTYLIWIYVREALDDKRKKLEQNARTQDFFSKSH